MDILATTTERLTETLAAGANGTLTLNPFQDGGDDHAEEDDTPTIAKVTSMVVLFSVSMVCGLVPFKLVRWFNLNPASPSGGTHLFLIRLLLSFGGGALLSTTFLHLLPEINHSIEELVETGALPEPDDLPFPLGEFLLTSGFFMIYLTEELVHWWMHRRSANARAASNVEKPVDTIAIDEAHSKGHELSHGHSHLPVGNVTAVYPITDIDGTPTVPSAVPAPAVASANGPLRGLLIVLALSIHELFEGLAVGLERSPSAVWLLFGAVASHKFVIAFCVAFELLVAAVQFRIAVAYIFVYSVVSPVGIGIGIALSSVNSDTNQTIEVVSVVLQGLASGTLIYVIFFEILAKDAGHSHGGGDEGGKGHADDHHHTVSPTNGLWQFLAVLAGFGLLLGIKAATGHSHGHSHGAGDDHDDHDHDH
ncbi:zinc transporter ZIP1-like [Anopheles maculipalpis]|uniref:zinc transporter ZIP1-like n=1 Tax=Anopheles maculipalpis TaxID=1496333 RepID=UPI0021596042|nr:zinc transporter ZIP1-like [Anopheles maculipalpis]